MTGVMEVSDAYLSSFAELEKAWSSNGAGWINTVRGEALEEFRRLGFPDVRDEQWKYTNVSPLRKIDFRMQSAAEVARLDPEEMSSFTFGGMNCIRITVIDGQFSEELSWIPSLPPGVQIRGLAAAVADRSLADDASSVERHLAKHASFKGRPFVAWNTAFLRDGAYVFVPRGVVLTTPVHLLYLSTARGEQTVSYPRTLIVAEESAQLAVIEDYASLAPRRRASAYLTNAVTEVYLGAGCALEHCKVEREGERAYHIASLTASQGRDSRFTSHSVSFGGGLVRNDIEVTLDDEGGECTLNGLTVIGESQHVDNHTRIVHARPRCSSWEVYKNILSDGATGVFNGKILVAQDAQKTDAKQSNQSLLLSDGATMNSKPELEIYADDVKCTHGATVGALDSESLFYLQTRGIDRETAESLLTYAFASEIVDSIQWEAVRWEIRRLLFSQLPQEFALDLS